MTIRTLGDANRVFVAIGLLLILGTSSNAQPPQTVRPPKRIETRPKPEGNTAAKERAAIEAEREKKTDTNLEIEILMQKGATALSAQTWARSFESIGREVRLRQPIGGESSKVTETRVAGVRRVKVVGELDSQGRILIDGSTFSPSQTTKLKEYIDDLAIFGSQGSPKGKPAWGLQKEKFEEVYDALTGPVKEDSRGKSWVEVLPMIQQDRYPIKFSTDIEKSLAKSSQKVRNEVRGLSRGTAAASVLSEFGLGFAPERNPKGEVELRAADLDQMQQPWPVGWPVDAETSRDKVVPELFKFEPIEFKEMSLGEFFPAVEAKAGLPILVNSYGCAKEKVKMEARVSVKPKKTFLASVISQAASPNFLKNEYRSDERGRGFVYITPMDLPNKRP